ncbi:MAG TPA: twin-arginine translocase TatA/TatE family subunit [Candidatus Limnocylindria bacterium]
MFGIGPEELMVILILALLVLGPERLPKVARDLGKIVGELRRTSDELRDEFLNADKYINPETPAIPATTAAQPPASESTAAGPTDENPFDREMREARERLRNI